MEWLRHRRLERCLWRGGRVPCGVITRKIQPHGPALVSGRRSVGKSARRGCGRRGGGGRARSRGQARRPPPRSRQWPRERISAPRLKASLATPRLKTVSVTARRAAPRLRPSQGSPYRADPSPKSHSVHHNESLNFVNRLLGRRLRPGEGAPSLYRNEMVSPRSG